MEIHSMKLAQALPGETSLILFNKNTVDKRSKSYDIKMMERGYFEVTPKGEDETFLVFPANIAWIRLVKEDKKPAVKTKKVE